jgi:DNA polymerase-1
VTPVIPLTRPPVRLAASGTFPLPGMPGCTYTVGREAVRDFDIGKLPGVIGVDIEGAGLDGRKRYDVKSVQMADERHCLIADPRDPAQFQIIRRVLNSGRTLVIHYSVFDAPVLYKVGLMDLDTCWNVEDTLIWARGADPRDKHGGHKLFQVTHKYLGMGDGTDPMPPVLRMLNVSTNTWYEDFDLNTPVYRFMAASDAIACARLRPILRQAFYDRLTRYSPPIKGRPYDNAKGHPFGQFGVKGDEAWRLVDREQITSQQALRRQCKGLLIDPDHLDKYRATVGHEMDELAGKIEEAGVKPGYGISAIRYLDKIGELPADHPRTPPTKGNPEGQWKSDAETMEAMDHPFAKLFIRHKKLEHDDAYLTKVVNNAIDGRIHPGTNKLTAATGRSSMSDPPLQQFTGTARGMILADNHELAARTIEHPVLDSSGDAVPCTCKNVHGLVSVDWSQIEPTLVAYIAKDTAAIEYYEAGNKVYDFVAAAGINVSYKQTKIILLGLLYGKGARRLAGELGCSVEEAKELVGLVWEALPGSRKLAGPAREGGLWQTIAQNYRLTFTLSGRIIPVPSGTWPCRVCGGKGWTGTPEHPEECWVPECRGKGKYFQVATHKGVNFPVQGGAYDLLAESEIAIKEADLSDALYLTMHDEMVVDAEAWHDIQKLMQQPTEVVMDRLELLCGRRPTFRTDWAHMGERWYKV